VARVVLVLVVVFAATLLAGAAATAGLTRKAGVPNDGDYIVYRPVTLWCPGNHLCLSRIHWTRYGFRYASGYARAEVTYPGYHHVYSRIAFRLDTPVQECGVWFYGWLRALREWSPLRNIAGCEDVAYQIPWGAGKHGHVPLS